MDLQKLLLGVDCSFRRLNGPLLNICITSNAKGVLSNLNVSQMSPKSKPFLCDKLDKTNGLRKLGQKFTSKGEILLRYIHI